LPGGGGIVLQEPPLLVNAAAFLRSLEPHMVQKYSTGHRPKQVYEFQARRGPKFSAASRQLCQKFLDYVAGLPGSESLPSHQFQDDLLDKRAHFAQ
jgi:hypothetical protein